MAGALLLLVGGVFPVAVASRFGALGIPRNDDWSYLLTAFRFAETGRISGNGWATMNLIGHLGLSLPVMRVFGFEILPLQIEVAGLGVLGLYAVFDLARQAVSSRHALFVALLVAVGPMWASLSVSYMTDVPAFACAMACLALGGRSLRQDDVTVHLLGASLAFGFLGFAIREYAIVAPLAVCIVALWIERARQARLIACIAASITLLALAAILFTWRRHLPDFLNTSPQPPTLRSTALLVQTSVRSAVLLGLMGCPAVVLAGPVHLLLKAGSRAPRSCIATLVIVVAALAGHLIGEGRTAFLLGPGNYVLTSGVLGTDTLSGIRPHLFPLPLEAGVALVAVLSAVVVSCVGVTWLVRACVPNGDCRRSAPPVSPTILLMTLATAGYAITAGLSTALHLTMYDRYLLPIVPLLAILLLRTGSDLKTSKSQRWAAGCVALVALCVFGAIYSMNSASFDGGKWIAAQQAAQITGNPIHVDGGLEWNSYHAGKLQTHVPGACITLELEVPEPPRDANVFTTVGIWGPSGMQAWVVARRRGPC